MLSASEVCLNTHGPVRPCDLLLGVRFHSGNVICVLLAEFVLQGVHVEQRRFGAVAGFL
jgi:hypothetical protein